MNISITDKALSKLTALQDGNDQFLRISIVSGGCNGNTYDAVIDNEMNDQDEVIFNENGVRIVADARSGLFLDGLKIDYSDDLIKAGFRLSNENAGTSCGCGASFAI